MADPQRLLIVGVSARAAAHSAVRGGLIPLAADCFLDEDLASICDGRRVDHYPAELENAAADLPQCPWLYTGGLENHPKLVDAIAERRPLLGNPGQVLRQVRDPFRLAEALRDDGLPCLDVSAEATPPDVRPATWLRKPRKSGGGRRIEFVSTIAPQSPAPDPFRHSPRTSFYYQRYAAGTACSAVFVAANGRSVLLATTQQLIGITWTGARGFEYAGSIGPLDTSPDQQTQWQRIGHCLASRFGLSGLFGVDAVMTDETIWFVEVNPRVYGLGRGRRTGVRRQLAAAARTRLYGREFAGSSVCRTSAARRQSDHLRRERRSRTGRVRAGGKARQFRSDATCRGRRSRRRPGIPSRRAVGHGVCRGRLAGRSRAIVTTRCRGGPGQPGLRWQLIGRSWLSATTIAASTTSPAVRSGASVSVHRCRCVLE